MQRIDWTKWAAIAEVVSSAAILLTLVYLAIQTQQVALQNEQLVEQTRQNNELMSIQASATAASLRTEVWRPTLEQPDVARLLVKDQRGEDLTDEEALRLRALWMRSLYNVEFAFYQIPEQRPQIIGVWRGSFAANRALQRLWNSGANDFFGPEFVDFMNSNVVNP
jgi:hypothetical protein